MTALRTFAVDATIRFHHCDPAGIAFFGRLDELFNAAFEDWCAAAAMPFADLMGRARLGFPLVHASVDYLAPLRLGDVVRIRHAVTHLGQSSVTFDLAITRGDVTCVRGRHVRVLTSLDSHRAVPLPPALRALVGEDA